MQTNVSIWPGSSSFFPGDTPLGYYDDDRCFQNDIETFSIWAGRKLGYPISDVELQDIHFFSCFEESVNEYSRQINTFQARDNIMNLLGLPTGSNVNLSNQYIEQTSNGLVKLAQNYGVDVGSGGNMTYYTGSIQVRAYKQTYDLKNTEIVLENGNIQTDNIIIRRLFYQPKPSILRYIDPSTGFGIQTLTEQFGWGSQTIPANTLIMPLYHDILRIQAIEFNEQLRKNTYSFQLVNNRLRIFPIPTDDYILFFHYTLENETTATAADNLKKNNGKITDFSNIPYGVIPYVNINHVGKQWIRKYALALCKELLCLIRGKYQSIPIPDGEVSLNSSDLISAGQQEQNDLIAELKEVLESFSRQSQLERKGAETDSLMNQLGKYPLKIYIR